MSVPRFEVAGGAIDGVNTVFTVSVPYSSGTTAYFLNGQLKRADYDDGWLETSPGTGVITVKEAPETGDVVQFFFLDTSPAQAAEEITQLQGTLHELEAVFGSLDELDSLSGMVNDTGQIVGSLADMDGLSGLVSDLDEIHGTLVEC